MLLLIQYFSWLRDKLFTCKPSRFVQVCAWIILYELINLIVVRLLKADDHGCDNLVPHKLLHIFELCWFWHGALFNLWLILPCYFLKVMLNHYKPCLLTVTNFLLLFILLLLLLFLLILWCLFLLFLILLRILLKVTNMVDWREGPNNYNWATIFLVYTNSFIGFVIT